MFLHKPSKHLLYPQLEGEGWPHLSSRQLLYAEEILTIVQQGNPVTNAKLWFLVQLMMLRKFSQILSLQRLHKKLKIRSKKKLQ